MLRTLQVKLQLEKDRNKGFTALSISNQFVLFSAEPIDSIVQNVVPVAYVIRVKKTDAHQV